MILPTLTVLRDLTVASVALRIFLAIIFGGLVGMERGMKNRPAGLRTYMLVCVGSCLIMLTNQYLYQSTGAGDPMRLGAQVVSGIGFLGAGTIVVTRRNHIKGLTTAAGLWAAAGVGLALGVGFYEGAILAGLAVFLILAAFQRLDNRMHQSSRMLDLYIEMSDDLNAGALLRAIRGFGVELDDVQLDQDTALEENTRALLVTLRKPRKTPKDDLLEQIRSIDGVLLLEEL